MPHFLYYQLRQLRVIRRSLTTRACTQLQARLSQQSAVRRNRPTAHSTSIGTESLREVGTSTAKVRSCFQWHPGEASLATHLTENYLQTLSPRLQVPSRRGPRIPSRDVDATVGNPASSPTPFGCAWKSPHPRTRTRTFGPRPCSVSGPSSYYSLPANLKNIKLTLQVFKSQLKTHLFHQANMDN